MLYAVQIDLPPEGELETSGNGTAPTDAQMAEEQALRQRFLDNAGPQLAALSQRPPQRSGNVSCAELLGADVWSTLNHYLLLVTVDIGDPRIDFDALLPPGGTATVVGAYDTLAEWPATTP
jgi:hypothetical protein